jgi:hypothetical protein
MGYIYNNLTWYLILIVSTHLANSLSKDWLALVGGDLEGDWDGDFLGHGNRDLDEGRAARRLKWTRRWALGKEIHMDSLRETWLKIAYWSVDIWKVIRMEIC